MPSSRSSRNLSFVTPWSAQARPIVLAWAWLLVAACGAEGASSGTLPSTTVDGDTQGSTGNANPSTTPTGSTNFAASDKLAIRGLTALPLSGCVSSGFVGSMTLGNDNFELLIDSGSSTTAVAATTCTSCSALSPLYDLTKGTDSGKSTSTTYGDKSSWTGEIITDNLSAQAEGVALTPPVPVTLAAITDETDFFTASMCPGKNDPANSFQGILGVGPDALLRPNTSSYLNSVKASKALDHDAFAVQLCNLGGRMWYGGYDGNVISGEPQYTPLLSSGSPASLYYGVEVSDIKFDNKTLGLSASKLGDFVVDTGTSLFYVNTATFNILAPKIAGDDNFKANFPVSDSSPSIIYSSNCSRSAKNLSPDEIDAALPQLSLSFPSAGGTGSFSLNLKATESYLLVINTPQGATYYCSTLAYNAGINIIGSAMMRRHVVVFDRDNAQIGFVPHDSCPNTYPTGTLN